MRRGDNHRLSAGPNVTRSGYTMGGRRSDKEGERERLKDGGRATGQGRQGPLSIGRGEAMVPLEPPEEMQPG